MKSIHSFFRWCKTTKKIKKKNRKNTLLKHIWWFFCGKTEGGLRRVKLKKSICKRQIQNSFLLSAIVHGEFFWNNDSNFFTRGIPGKTKQIRKWKWRVGNFPFDTSLKKKVHSAMVATASIYPNQVFLPNKDALDKCSDKDCQCSEFLPDLRVYSLFG